MRNNILFMLIAGSLFFMSCATANRASYSSQGFTNGIYYKPNEQQANRLAQAREDLSDLKGQTNKALNSSSKSTFDSRTGVETIYIGDTNAITIDYNPYKTYLLTDDMESYLARAEKYDSPLYTVNIDMGVRFYDGWYRPYWSTYGYGWHNPYWGPYYSWWGPSYHYGHYYGWYDPWYYGWYDPWYYGYYGYGWYDPWWGPGYYPPYGPGFYPIPPHHHGPSRDIYYGKRENGGASPSYGGRGGGSYTRRDATMNPVRGNNSNNGNITTSATPPQGAGNRNTGGSAYRRSANPKVKENATVTGTNNRQNSNSQHSSYGRSSQTRSSSSSSYNRGNSSGYNSSGSYRSNSSSGSGRSGGSSYRR